MPDSNSKSDRVGQDGTGRDRRFLSHLVPGGTGQGLYVVLSHPRDTSAKTDGEGQIRLSHPPRPPNAESLVPPSGKKRAWAYQRAIEYFLDRCHQDSNFEEIFQKTVRKFPAVGRLGTFRASARGHFFRETGKYVPHVRI